MPKRKHFFFQEGFPYTDIGIKWKSPSDGQGHSPRHATPTPSAWAWPKSVRFKIHENNWWVWLPPIWYKIQLVSSNPLSSPGTGWHKSSHRSHNVARTEWAVHFIWELKHPPSWLEPALCTSSPPQRARWWMYTGCIPDHEHLSIVQFWSYFPHHLVALEGRRIVFPILVKDWALYTCAQLIAPSTNWSWR